MLTANQREMIEERREKSETLNTERKKYIDFTLRNYVKKQLDSIGDVLKALDVLPEKQIESLITADRIIGILKLLKKISFDLVPIEPDAQGNPQVVYRFRLIIKLDKPIKGKDYLIQTLKYMFPATPEEAEMMKELGPYMDTLGNLFTTEEDIRGYTMEEWNKYGTIRLHEMLARRGQSFKFEFDENESFVVAAEELKKGFSALGIAAPSSLASSWLPRHQEVGP